MKLTRYSDYAMRVLTHLAAQNDRLASIGMMSRAYGISHNHLMKVVHDLRLAGFLKSARGRSGGVMLARPPAEIRISDVVRHTERKASLVDCSTCAISPLCVLNATLEKALDAFYEVLDSYTIADLVDGRRAGLQALLSRDAPLAAGAKAA